MNLSLHYFLLQPHLFIFFFFFEHQILLINPTTQEEKKGYKKPCYNNKGSQQEEQHAAKLTTEPMAVVNFPKSFKIKPHINNNTIENTTQDSHKPKDKNQHQNHPSELSD
ncbi:hypothetical protein MtrunA17_Chr4g0059041 [Medicago truncatula]|uniref:Transmembrane protein n=1 Tax=Medicago truncatula TaxID=3880 RepID=A0A396IFD0_MEDTR|nr:hypothetical protein MtrunA17_Chr4g0059041 [Medicago truncatula]